MSDFSVGLAVGQTRANGVALGWRDRAENLTKQLEESDQLAGALQFRLNAAITVLKEMAAEIGESNPDSSYASKDFVRQRLAELSVHFAHEDGYEIDLQGNRAWPTP